MSDAVDSKQTSVADTAKVVYDKLAAHSKDEQQRILRAVRSFLGDEQDEQVEETPTDKGEAKGVRRSGKDKQGSEEPAAYFVAKVPTTKVERLAVAARFLETVGGKEACTRADLQEVFKQARQNFDVHNFPADMANAKARGFFLKGKKDHYQLSYPCQQFVDALPDRAVAKMQMSKKPGRRGKPKKKSPQAKA